MDIRDGRQPLCRPHNSLQKKTIIYVSQKTMLQVTHSKINTF